MNCSDILPQCKRSFLVVEDAVKGNKMHVLQWIETNLSHCLLAELQQDKSVNEGKYVFLAVQNGNFCIVKWLILKGFSCNSDCCLEAVSNGSLDIVQYLLSINCAFDKNKMFPAATNSFNVDVLEWLFQQGCPFMEKESFRLASYHGNFEFINWMKLHGSTAWESYIKKIAAAQGNLEALKWALDQDQKANDRDNCMYILIINAASGGHLHVIEWLKSNSTNFFLDPHVGVVAAREGRIELLQWAITNGCQWDIYKCCIAAIENSRLKVLIWIKTIDHNIFSCTYLYNLYSKRHPNARAINTDVLKWLQINGFTP
jgi:hypothetical protein